MRLCGCPDVSSWGLWAEERGQSWDLGDVNVLTLTSNGTGNNAFPSFSSDGSEVWPPLQW
jgi:hypothetical protein